VTSVIKIEQCPGKSDTLFNKGLPEKRHPRDTSKIEFYAVKYSNRVLLIRLALPENNLNHSMKLQDSTIRLASFLPKQF